MSWPKKILKAENFFIFFIIIFIILFILQVPNDPDLGWHLRNGQYLIEHNLRVPQTDLYSYTMTDFPVIMHEWLTDLIMYFLYSHFGFISLIIFFVIITFLAFFIVARTFKANLSYQLLGCLLGIIASLPVISIRAQMITLLGLALVIYIIYQYKNQINPRLIYCLPLIFLLWANLHGGFFVGILFIGLFIFIELIKVFLKNKIKDNPINFQILSPAAFKKLFIILALCLIATLLNPYFIRIYYEVFTTVFDDYAKNFIMEWAPLTIHNQIGQHYIIYSALIFILILFNLLFYKFKNFDFTYLMIAVSFFLISISSMRHLPFFVLITIPYWVILVRRLTGDNLQTILKQKWLILLLLIGVIIYANQKLTIFYKIADDPQKIAEIFGYPYQAIQFLKDHPQGERMFNEYNWGGYLIWQYPEKKVFIDGRMASWRLKRAGQTQIILKDFVTLKNANKGWEELLNSYQIDNVIVYNDAPLAWELKNSGWLPVYQDQLAIIYKKP